MTASHVAGTPLASKNQQAGTEVTTASGTFVPCHLPAFITTSARQSLAGVHYRFTVGEGMLILQELLKTGGCSLPFSFLRIMNVNMPIVCFMIGQHMALPRHALHVVSSARCPKPYAALARV